MFYGLLDLDPGTKKNIENVKSPKKLQSMATFSHNCFEINIFLKFSSVIQKCILNFRHGKKRPCQNSDFRLDPDPFKNEYVSVNV